MRYLFVLLWLYSSVISAVLPIPYPGAVQALMDNKATDASLTTLPNPGHLSADWWLFFDTDPTLLKGRIEQFAEELKPIEQELTAAGKPDAKANIIHLNADLLAYLETLSKTAPNLPAVITLQKTYTVDEWLDIVHKRRTLHSELQSAQEDLLFDENRVKVAEQRFDSLTAAYRQSDDKASQGILLMAAWAEFAGKGEQLRLQKQMMATNKAQLEQLIKVCATAEERLAVSEAYLQQLKKDVQIKEQEFNSAHTILTGLEAATKAGNANSDESQAYTLLFEQGIRNAAINEDLANAVFSREKVELALVQLLISKDSAEFQAIGKELQNDAENITLINGRLGVWRDETEREQARAGKSLAALFIASSIQTNDVVKLTQQRLTEVQDSLLSLQRLDSEILDARLLADRAQVLMTGKEGALKNGLDDIKIFSVQTWKLLGNNLTTSVFKIGQSPVTTLGILRLLLIVTMAWALSYFVRRGLRHFSEWRHGSAGFMYTLGRLTHYLILITGISIGLSSIGVDLSSFALIAGGLSLGVGFGLQAIVSNFVSGLIVLFERSLRIGDFIELSTGVAGEVRAINVRSTLVTTPDMVEILGAEFRIRQW